MTWARTTTIRCERPSASEEAARRGLRGRGAQSWPSCNGACGPIRVGSASRTRTACSSRTTSSRWPTAWAATRPVRSPARSPSRSCSAASATAVGSLDDVLAAVVDANGEIFRAATENIDQQGMGTTLTGLFVVTKPAQTPAEGCDRRRPATESLRADQRRRLAHLPAPSRPAAPRHDGPQLRAGARQHRATSPTTRPAPTRGATSSPAPSASTPPCASTRGRCRSCAATASCSAPTACRTRSTTTRSTRSSRRSATRSTPPTSSSPRPTAAGGRDNISAVVVDVVEGRRPAGARRRARHRAGVGAGADAAPPGPSTTRRRPSPPRSRTSRPSPATRASEPSRRPSNPRVITAGGPGRRQPGSRRRRVAGFIGGVAVIGGVDPGVRHRRGLRPPRLLRRLRRRRRRRDLPRPTPTASCGGTRRRRHRGRSTSTSSTTHSISRVERPAEVRVVRRGRRLRLPTSCRRPPPRPRRRPRRPPRRRRPRPPRRCRATTTTGRPDAVRSSDDQPRRRQRGRRRGRVAPAWRRHHPSPGPGDRQSSRSS